MDYQELKQLKQLKQLEDDRWEAADQLRANSKLTASEYSMPVLGLIFLRHATTRFNDLLPEVEKSVAARATGALHEGRLKLGCQGKAEVYGVSCGTCLQPPSIATDAGHPSSTLFACQTHKQGFDRIKNKQLARSREFFVVTRLA